MTVRQVLLVEAAEGPQGSGQERRRRAQAQLAAGQEPHAEEAQGRVDDIPGMKSPRGAERQGHPEEGRGSDPLRMVPKGHSTALVGIPERELVMAQKTHPHRLHEGLPVLPIVVLGERVGGQHGPPGENAQGESEHRGERPRAIGSFTHGHGYGPEVLDGGPSSPCLATQAHPPLIEATAVPSRRCRRAGPIDP